MKYIAHFGDLSGLPLRVKVVRSGMKKKKKKWGAALVTPIYNGQNELLPFSRQLPFAFAFTLWTFWPSGAVHSQTIIFDGEEVEVLLGSR